MLWVVDEFYHLMQPPFNSDLDSAPWLIPPISLTRKFINSGPLARDGVVGGRDGVDRELADAPPPGRRVRVLLEVRHPEPRQETQGEEVSERGVFNASLTPLSVVSQNGDNQMWGHATFKRDKCALKEYYSWFLLQIV